MFRRAADGIADRGIDREIEVRSFRAIEAGRDFDAIDGEVVRWWFSAIPQEEYTRVAPFAIPRFRRTLSQWVNLLPLVGNFPTLVQKENF